MSSKWAAEKMSSGISQSAHVSNEHCSAHFRLSTVSFWEMKMFGFRKWKLSFLRIYWPSIALVAANIYLLCAYLLYENKLEFTRHFCCCGSSAQRWELSKKFSSLLLNLFVQRHSAVIFPPLRSCHMPRERFLETRWVFNWVFLHPREKDPGAPTT